MSRAWVVERNVQGIEPEEAAETQRWVVTTRCSLLVRQRRGPAARRRARVRVA